MNIFTRIRTFWGISIILMEVVVVFFVFYIFYFFWIENPTPTSNILIVRAFTKEVVSIPNEVATESWETYTDGSHGITFQHPADLTVYADEMSYGSYTGDVTDLKRGDNVVMTVRIFPLQAEETEDKDDSIMKVYERLFGVSLSTHQYYEENVDDLRAVVVRKRTGDTSSDMIYFIGNRYLLEASFNQATANMLATFRFTQKSDPLGDASIIDHEYSTKIVYTLGDTQAKRDDCARRNGNYNSCGNGCNPDNGECESEAPPLAICIPICVLTDGTATTEEDQATVNTDDWKVYANSDVGISFRYPSSYSYTAREDLCENSRGVSVVFTSTEHESRFSFSYNKADCEYGIEPTLLEGIGRLTDNDIFAFCTDIGRDIQNAHGFYLPEKVQQCRVDTERVNVRYFGHINSMDRETVSGFFETYLQKNEGITFPYIGFEMSFPEVNKFQSHDDNNNRTYWTGLPANQEESILAVYDKLHNRTADAKTNLALREFDTILSTIQLVDGE